jgi:hypothetical protein
MNMACLYGPLEYEVDGGKYDPCSGGGYDAPKILTGALRAQTANAANRKSAWSIVGMSLGNDYGRRYSGKKNTRKPRRGEVHKADGNRSFSERTKYMTACNGNTQSVAACG